MAYGISDRDTGVNAQQRIQKDVPYTVHRVFACDRLRPHAHLQKKLSIIIPVHNEGQTRSACIG